MQKNCASEEDDTVNNIKPMGLAHLINFCLCVIIILVQFWDFFVDGWYVNIPVNIW